MTTKVPQEYTEDKEPEQPEQLYYGPYRPPEEAFTTDLLRIYSDVERGTLSAGAYVADRVSSVFDKSDEDIPATQEERDERLMRLQKTMTTLQRSGSSGVLPAVLGYFKNKNEPDIFEPSGKVRPVDTTAGTIAQIGTYVAGGVGSYRALPEVLPSLARVLASEQAVEQVMIPSGTDNIANIIYAVLPENVREDTIGEVADFLSTSPDDTESAQRLKTSLVSLGVTAIIAGVGVTGVAVGKGLFNTDVGQAALENLRKIKPSFKGKTPEELTESQQADVIVESLSIAREQAAKVKEDSARALNMRGEGVGVPSGKPRPTRDQFEDGPEGSTKFKAALTRWKTQDTPKDLTLPTMSSVLEETAEGVTQVQAQNASFFKRLQQRFFTSRGYFTPKAQRLFDDSKNAQKAAIQEVSGIALRIKKEIDRVGSLTSEGATATGRTTEEVTDQVRKAFEFNATKDLYELPRGERVEFYRTNFGLTPELAEQVYKAREMIDQFSRRLYNNVATTPAMRATIESNLGSYFKRSYRAWEDPGFKPDPALKTDAIEATYNDLMRTPPHAAEIKRLKEQDETGEELEDYLLKVRRQAESEIDDKLEFVQDREVIDFLAQVRGAPGLHKRGDLNAETRALLGEIHDPLENMILTITKSSRVYEQNNFYTRIAALGRSGGWIGTRNPAEGRTVRIEGTNNFSLDGFADDTAAKAAGLPNAASSWTYTTPEIARALNNKEVVPTMFDMENAGGEIFRFLAGAKGATQASKTVYNHTVHIRNAYGVGHFTLANGINPFVRDGYEPFKVLVNDIFQGGDEALDQTYNKFLRLGLVDTNVRVNEFRALLSTGFEDNPTDYINRTILSPESPLRKFLEPVTPPPGVVNFAPSVYRATDDYGKISGYAYELKQLKAAYPNEPIEVLEQEAAEIIKNTFPNYSRVPRGVQQLRYLPIGDYTGFVSESIRTTAHIIKRGAQEIRSDNPIIKARGRQRLAGYVTAGAVGFSAAGTASQYMMGWDEEDAKAYNILAEGKYSTGADNRIWSYDSEGNVQFVDTRSLDAFSVIRDPFVIAANRALTGDLEAEELDAYITDAVATAAWNFAEPYVSPSMLTEAFLDIGVGAFHPRGENHKGKVIFEPKMDSVDRALVVIDRLWETIEPGSIPNIQKLDEALQGIENPYDGDPKRQKDTEIYANFLGFRRQPFDADRSLEIAVERYNELSERNYTSSLNLENNAETLEEALEDYIKVQQVERNAQQDLYAVVMAYAHLNDQDSMYKYDNTMAALEELGVGTVFRSKLVNGSFHPDKINQVFNELIDRQKLVRAFPDAEKYMFAYESVRNRLNKESLSKYNSDAFEVLLDDQAELEERQAKAKGGEVFNVPNVPREPDQRVDKMTGLPYDQQAGTAFVDEEDPLRRLGFTGGGEVDPLRRLGFVPGGTVIARGLRELFTPTKTVGREGSKRVVQDPDKPVVMTQTEELEETLEPKKSEDYLAAINMKEEDITAWQEANRLPQSKRQQQRPEIIQSLQQVLSGKKAIEEHTKLVDEVFPPFLYTKENAPEFPTLVEVRGAVGKKTLTGGRGIIDADVSVEEGRRVSSRLDIPAYDQRGVWAVTLHEPGKSGKAFAYGQSAILKNVEFTTNPKDALDIAMGQAKGTIARIEGDWVNHDSRKTYTEALGLLDSNEWVQVGMNPYKHSYFYDKATMKPLKSASEVIQVGPLVLAKKDNKLIYAEADDFKVDLSPESIKGKKKLRDQEINVDSVSFMGGGKVLKALSRGRYSTGKEVRADMRRSDGSVKSAQGFLGPVENTVQGGTMTEVSIGTEINGKKMEIPTMVPTLTEDEVKTLSSMKLEGNARNIPESIIMKAKEHARMRLEQGKSPFYQDDE